MFSFLDITVQKVVLAAILKKRRHNIIGNFQLGSIADQQPSCCKYRGG